MSIQTCIHLHARPDFSLFRFHTGIGGSVLIELRFVILRPGVYDLLIEERQAFPVFYPFLVTTGDVEELLMAVIQVIELYTGKYQDRIIRLKGANKIQSLLFRIILRSQHETLCPLFTIDEEGKSNFFPFHRPKGNNIFLLKRRPDAALKTYPVQLTLDTHSRLFGNPIHVRLYEEPSATRA